MSSTFLIILCGYVLFFPITNYLVHYAQKHEVYITLPMRLGILMIRLSFFIVSMWALIQMIQSSDHAMIQFSSIV